MKISATTLQVFELEKESITFYLDKKSTLYWSLDNIQLLTLDNLPWKYQLPFYLRFLHNNELAQRFKDMEIVGAIDVFIKREYFFGDKTKSVPCL